LKGRYDLRVLGDVIVKGKSEAVSIFEVVGRDEAPTREFEASAVKRATP
jgi:hypothetical protein